MVRYKRTPRRGTLTPEALARLRSLYGAPPPARVRSVVTEESRVVGPIVISDDEEVAAPSPLQPSDHEEVPAPPLQPVGPSAPTADPSPLSSNDALRLMRIRQELADLRREVNAFHADIAKALDDNKL